MNRESYFKVDYPKNYKKDDREPVTYSITLPIKNQHNVKNFGWEFVRYYGFDDKLNFLYLQIQELLKAENARLYNNHYIEPCSIVNKISAALSTALEEICARCYNLKKEEYGSKWYFRIYVDHNAVLDDSIYAKDPEFEPYEIDHNSAWVKILSLEKIDKLLDKLITKEGIIDYLLGYSYIQGGNDNERSEDLSPSYLESRKYMKNYLEETCGKEGANIFDTLYI